MTEFEAHVGFTRRSFVAASALAMGAVAGVAGCANGGASASSNTASGSSESSESSSAESAKPTELRAALDYPAPVAEASPVGNTRALWVSAGWHVYEALYELDYVTYSAHNALAAGEPVQLSDLEFEVALREEAKFSDGSAVTAADVVNAFNRDLESATYASMLSFIASVVAKDETTVLFTLRYPVGDLFQRRLSLVKVFPASMTDEELSTAPRGSGPWQYEPFEGDFAKEISFVPNPHYNGSVPAQFDRMVWTASSDANERCDLLIDKSVAVCENTPFPRVNDVKNSSETVEYIQGFGQPFLMFNCRKKPFDDPRVRQAFFYAINVEKLIDDVMDGHAAPVTSFLPKTFANYHEASTVYSYNPDKARVLLAEAGVKELTFTMTVNNNWVKDLADSIQSDLNEVGITMENDESNIDWSALAPSDDDAILPFDVVLTPGDPTCFGADPDLLMSWWYGDNVWTRGRSCWAKAGDGKFEELQQLLQKARELSGDERQNAWNACFDLIAEEVPLYALFHREVATGFDESQIGDFEAIGTTGLMLLGVSPRESS
ncbi:MAG: ABC transporter substrate-binding protein [Eggerthellaceae bacterium]|nr:ABC transporter substrate-binding protein [Eggerthellaceae bacterium]